MRDLELSVLDLSPVPSGSSTSAALHETIELGRTVERAGYRRMWLAEHHGIPSVASSSPEILIQAVADATSTLRVGSGGIMLPNHSPLKVAETFRALAGLHPGRIDLGIGRAPGADQVTAWALRRSQEGLGHEDFVEHVQLVSAWLSPHGVRVGMGMTLTATPAASGYPEIWLLGSSDYSARLAAKLGIRYAYAGHFGHLDPAAVFALYRDTFEPSETLAEPHAMLCTSALVGATEEEAAWLSGPATIQWLNIRRDTREPLPSEDEAARRIEAMGGVDFSGTKVVGTADQVRTRLEELVADCEVQELMVMTTAYQTQTRIDTLAALL